MQWLKKIAKAFSIVLSLFFLALVANLLLEKWFFPKFSDSSFLKRFAFLQNFNEKTTIINRTEQVVVKEENSLALAAEKIHSATVRIMVSLPEKNKVNGLINQDFRLESRVGTLATNDGLIVSWADQATGDFLLQNKDLQYKVLLSDQTGLEADLVGYDSYSQLIFYRVRKAGNWMVPTWGDSSRLTVGDDVGMVFLSKNGAPESIIENLHSREENFSLLNSDLASSEKLQGIWLLSSQESVSRKNVGSPVINSDGEVVGIAGLLEKNNQLISIVLPLQTVKGTIDSFIKNESTGKPFFGVYYLPISQDLYLSNHLATFEGALIYSFSGQQGLAVLRNSPAEKIGLRIGDIILEINGEKITAANSLSKLVSEKKVGDEINVKFLRDGKEQEGTAILE